MLVDSPNGSPVRMVTKWESRLASQELTSDASKPLPQPTQRLRP
jgi:hypothetical protein